MMKSYFCFLLLLLALSCKYSSGTGIVNGTGIFNGTGGYNETNTTGSGMSCYDITCTGGGWCVDEYNSTGPECRCPAGKQLSGWYHCEDCPIGKWGNDCNQSCSDNCGGKGRIASCNASIGTCVCNSCWQLSGTTCSIEKSGAQGYQCFVDYTKSINKVQDLTNYGGDIPQPRDTKWTDLAKHFIDTDATIIQASSEKLTIIERDDINARDLARFSFVLTNKGSSDYQAAVSSIKENVKNGRYRGTLIIDESDDTTATITINV